MELSVPMSLPAPQRLDDLLWTWVLPLAAVLLSTVAATAAGRSIAIRADNPLTPPDESRGQGGRRLIRGLVQALVFLFCIASVVVIDRTLHGEPRSFRVLAQTAGLVIGLWVGFKSLDALDANLRVRLYRQGRVAASTVLPLLRRVLKATWFSLVFLLYLDNLGMNVSALLAGLGVGGLAVALAGKKTIENLFGGMVLALDQPVRVGDFCKFGDKQGTVEDVGLRSIKIRTPERTLISVPNGAFSELTIENVADRDCIRFYCTLALRYDSSADQLSQILTGIELLLEAHPKVDKAQAHFARLVDLGAYSINVDVLCHFSTRNWDEFLRLRQALYLDQLRLIEGAGTHMAYPTRTLVSEGRLTGSQPA